MRDSCQILIARARRKNGNLLLNVALYPDGSLPPESQTLLSELAPWVAVNAEAIHGTRPWIALVFDVPQRLPTRHASAFKISFDA